MPCCLSWFLGRFFQAQDREQLCWEPVLVAMEGQASTGSCGIATTLTTRGGHQWPTPAAFHSSFEAGLARGFRKLGATALEWGNGSISWCNISIYWFKSSLLPCFCLLRELSFKFMPHILTSGGKYMKNVLLFQIYHVLRQLALWTHNM